MRLQPAVISALSLLTFATAASADVEVGQLTCRQTDRANLVFFSEANYACTFDPIQGANERYEGTVNKVGLDLSTSKVETMVWYVLAPSADAAPGALAGDYFGASADAALGAGAGARVLVGGFDRSFTLQPAAVSGTEGVGVAIGIEQFELSAR